MRRLIMFALLHDGELLTQFDMRRSMRERHTGPGLEARLVVRRAAAR
jgi:hypothetical protein